jgi:DNA processing protein
MSTLFSHFTEKINQIAPLEHEFTEVLDAIALKPKTLYFRGKLPENMSKIDNRKTLSNNKNHKKSTAKNRTKRPPVVAIVGSRHNTIYGQEIAYQIAFETAKRGAIVVSGLAYGIDKIAHQGALAAGGKTVAVLGNPIDKVHPAAHTKLAREIIQKGGAIISEYAPCISEFKDSPLVPGEFYNKLCRKQINYQTSFLYRNRIISGLSDVVIVVEAAEKSGSLNTAAHAIEQGKEVFAVPGNITNPYSQGCNKLIKQGANPYTEIQDILRLLFPEEFIKKGHKMRQAKILGDNDNETAILAALVQGLRSGEEIMQFANLTPDEFNETTTILEIKGRIRALGANNWSLY